MKRLIIFLLLFAAIKVAGQTTGYLRFDTVKIMKQNGTCELYIINKTKDTLGILTNVGGGLTQFRKSRVLNDSTIVVGLDTLVIIGGAGGGGGSGSVTSISQGYGIVATPNPITSTGTIRADTSGTNGLVTRTELLDSTDITTQVESPIYVKLRSSWPVPDTLAIDTTRSTTRAWLYKVADSLIVLMASSGVANTNLGAGFRWLVPSSQGIKTAENTATVTWDSVGTNTLRATVPDNAITDAKLRQSAARSVIGRSANSTGNVADITSSTANRALTDNGTSLDWRQIDLTNTVTGALPEDNLAAFRTYPAESNNEIVLLDQSAWTAGDLGAQFSRGANHTISLNGSFPRIASSTIVWGGASLTRFLPNLPIIAIYDKIEVDYQIVSALASNVGFGPSMFSNNVNGANFGYTTYLAVATSTATPHFAKQDGTSDQTAATFTVSQGDVIRQTIEFLDTVAIATFQNLTTSSVVRTITKSFVAGVAPYPPNTGTWGFQNFSGTYEIRRVKITTRKTMSPTLMVAFDSKGQIVASPWDRRFPSLLNARYPTVLNYSGGGDQLKDLIDKKIEFSRINPEQVLIGLGSNDLRYGSSLSTTIDRLRRVVRMISGSTTRWAVTVVPEDSTAGGLSGLTALKNWMAAEYPSNYVDLWTFMSTSNVLKAEFNSGDGVHTNTRGHFVKDSLIAASGFFSVQSPNRRSPYQKFGGGIWATGDSLYGPFKTPLSINSMLRFNDSNQVTHSLAFDNGSRVVVSANYPQAQTPTAGTIMQVDGGFSVTSNTGFIGINDKTNTSNRHSFQSDNNVLRHAYNGTEDIYIDNLGLLAIGAINSGLTFPPTFWINKDRTMIAGSVDSRGIFHVVDTNTVTMPGGTHSNVYANKFSQTTFSAGSAEQITRPINVVVEGLTGGANTSLTNPYAFGVLKGRSLFDSTISLNNIPTGSGTYFLLVKRSIADSSVAQVASTTFATQSALNDTASAIRTYVSTGTYTPTLTNTSNVAASAVYGNFYYTRIGNLVTVTGVISIDPTAAATQTQLDISLPIASALTNFWQLTGQATANASVNTVEAGAILGDVTNDRATLVFLTGSFTGNGDYTIRFTYEVL